MGKTETILHWLEELFLMYEFTYMRTSYRLVDFKSNYGVCKETLRAAIRYRLGKELDCRERWPLYVSYAEDAKFRKEK